MTDAISSLFGGKPKQPKLVTQPIPIEKISQSNIEKDKVMRDLAKRRRATVMNQLTQANIRKQTLGAGA